MNYEEFIAAKLRDPLPTGIAEPRRISTNLFPFQRDAVRFALQRGRAALFEDCGLGKTGQQLEWAQHVVEHTGRPVLVLAPLAVTQQTIREGEKFMIRVRYARNQGEADPRGITVTNYERLSAFDAAAFGGVVLDESSILKSYMGATKRQIIAAFARTPFRLACTATPAPNDHSGQRPEQMTQPAREVKR